MRMSRALLHSAIHIIFSQAANADVAAISQHNYAPADVCWDATFTASRCCYPISEGGDKSCFSEQFSFQFCCAQEISVYERNIPQAGNTEVAASSRHNYAAADVCWDAEFTPGSCCHPVSEGGYQSCFSEEFSFHFCCSKEISVYERKLKALEHHRTVTLPQRDAFLEQNCWRQNFTKERCCAIEQFKFNDGHWSNEKYPGCFHGNDNLYTAENCCKDTIREKKRRDGLTCWKHHPSEDSPLESAISLFILGEKSLSRPEHFSESKCCFPLPLGNANCWAGHFTFDRCCSHLMVGKEDIDHHVMRYGDGQLKKII